MGNNNNIGAAIVHLRYQRQLSQEQLAEMSGMSRTQLSHIENGNANPSIKTVSRLAAALEVPVDFLVNFGASNEILDTVYDDCSRWERLIINDIVRATYDALKRYPYSNTEK